MADKEIYWLAGLLEGEGCFSMRGEKHNPLIQLVMTDKDVVIRAAKKMGAYKVIECNRKTKGGLSIYRTILYGKTTYELMEKLYPIMGRRRSKKIAECIMKFKSRMKDYNARKPINGGAKIVWEGGDYYC